MKRRSLSRASIAGLLGAVALGAVWIFFGPAQLGGSTSYAVVVGSSMEPLLHRGDLAIVRTGGTYAPGDVVLYKSDEFGANVLHRIESVQGERFALKGDNNGFLDSERPLESQIVGELWLNVPEVGRVTGWMQEPVHSASVVGLATLLALGGGVGFGRVRRRRSGRDDGSRSSSSSPSSGNPLDLQPLALGAGALLALGALLAFAAFTHPTTRSDTLPEAYVHQGKFDYSAEVPANVVYPDGRVATGEPIFLKLVPRLRIAFAYQLQSKLPVRGVGRIGLIARLSDGRGWEQRIVLAPKRAFRGGEASIAGTLDLRRVQTLLERMRDLTGSSQAAYSLTILPAVSLKGRAGDELLETTFAPALGFDLGDLRLQPDLDGSGEGVSPFAPREAGTGTHVVANELSLGALEVPVETARWLSLIGLAAGLLLGLLALGALRRRYHGTESERIAARYGHLLLPITARPQDWSRITDLADMESLVRLAERHDRMILQLHERGESSYVVEEGAGVYRYRTPAPAPASAPASAESLPAPAEPEAAPAHPGERDRGHRRGRLRWATFPKAPRS